MRLHGLTRNLVGHRAQPAEFDYGHVSKVFHLSVHHITFGVRSTHLAYLVYKSGRKTSNISYNGLIIVDIDLSFKSLTGFLLTYYLGYYYITYYLYSAFEWLLLVRALY